MSGGVIDYQKEKGEHQVVTFTFAGPLNDRDVDEWNNQIVELKRRFGEKIMGVTVKGQRTAAKWRAAPRKK